MKKVLWTTVFWIIIVLGFVFYMRMYNAPLANNVSEFIGATALVSHDTLTEEESLIMQEIVVIKEMLADIQVRLGGDEIVKLPIEKDILEVEAE